MLEEKLNDALKEAMKSGEKVKVSTLRMLISEIKNRKIAEKAKELDDDKVTSTIQKMAKQHKESIEKFKEGGRLDLVKKEEEELAILAEFLPEQMPEVELKKIVAEAVAATGASSAQDMGKVMREVMDKVKGQADGKLVNKLVREKLS